MTPIDRVRARYKAKSLLGVSDGATKEEIHKAYKRQAFAHHPDREDGSDSDLQSINAAYELLKNEAPDEHHMQRSGVRPTRVPSRPSPSSSINAIDEVTQARARSILREPKDAPSEDHVAETVRKEGRRLTFMIPTKLAKGRNRVAVPSDLLASRRSQMTKVITFRTTNEGAGQVKVPEACVKADFPGAHEVILQFGIGRN